MSGEENGQRQQVNPIEMLGNFQNSVNDALSDFKKIMIQLIGERDSVIKQSQEIAADRDAARKRIDELDLILGNAKNPGLNKKK